MRWIMLCFALQSMGRTNHKLPIYATRNVQAHLKSTVCPYPKSTLTMCVQVPVSPEGNDQLNLLSQYYIPV